MNEKITDIHSEYPQLLIKFIESKYLDSFLQGNLYFSNAKIYRNLEEKQQQKGQGDKLEGILNFTGYNTTMQSNDNPSKIYKLPDKIDFTSCFPYIDNKPVFCLFACNANDCQTTETGSVYLKFNEETKKQIQRDFPKSDKAIIIKNPKNFITKIMQKFNITKVDKVSYFHCNTETALSEEMLNYICQSAKNAGIISPTEVIMYGICPTTKEIKYLITTNNVWRLLFCKDNYFKGQQEFRIILPNENIFEPKEYNFDFNGVDFSVVDTYDLLKGITI
jgi:hypothetical protein